MRRAANCGSTKIFVFAQTWCQTFVMRLHFFWVYALQCSSLQEIRIWEALWLKRRRVSFMPQRMKCNAGVAGW